MMYLAVYWVLTILLVVAYLLGLLFNKEKTKDLVEKYAILLILFVGSFLIVAIVTKDPISFGSYEIPTEFQWIGSLFVSFFSVWQFYLKPLKNKLFGLDREIGEVKTSVKKVESDVNRLTDFIINKKK